MPATVKMYCTTWCPDCHAAKRFLERAGVPYEVIDIDKVPGAAEKVMKYAGGYKTVPTFEIGGTIIVDFDRRKLEEVLGLNK